MKISVRNQEEPLLERKTNRNEVSKYREQRLLPLPRLGQYFDLKVYIFVIHSRCPSQQGNQGAILPVDCYHTVVYQKKQRQRQKDQEWIARQLRAKHMKNVQVNLVRRNTRAPNSATTSCIDGWQRPLSHTNEWMIREG